MATERQFHKDGQTRSAYTPAQVINLTSAGWHEGEAPSEAHEESHEESHEEVHQEVVRTPLVAPELPDSTGSAPSSYEHE